MIGEYQRDKERREKNGIKYMDYGIKLERGHAADSIVLRNRAWSIEK